MGEVVLEAGFVDIGQSFATEFDSGLHVVGLDVTQHGRLDAAVRKVEARTIRVGSERRCRASWSAQSTVAMFDLRGRKLHGSGIPVLSEAVDNRASGITQAQEFGDF